MQILGKILAGVISLIYVPLAALAAIAFALQTQLYTPSTYKSLLVDGEAYQRFPGLLADSLAVAANSSAPDGTIRTILEEILPYDLLRETTEPAIEQLVTFVRGEGSSLVLDLEPLKKAARANLPAALEKAQDGLPACSTDQHDSSTLELFKCRAEPAREDEMLQRAHNLLDGVFAEMPDSRTIPLEQEGDVLPLEQRRLIRIAMLFSPLAPLAVYLVICALSARTWSAALIWFAIPTLMAALAVSAIGLVSRSLAPRFVNDNILPRSDDPLNMLAGELIIDLAKTLATGTIIAGATLAVMAIAALLVTGTLRKAAAPPGKGYY